MAAAVVLLSPLLWLGFRRLDLTGRSVAVVAVIWGLLMVEMALYPNQNTVPPGIFHPEIGGLSFRLVDVVVLAALAARLTTTGVKRFGVAGMLWTALVLWLATAGVFGLIGGNPFDQLSFESRIIIYLGAIVLTAGIPVERYFQSRFLLYLIGFSALLAAVLLVTDTAGLQLNLGARPPDDAALLLDSTEAIDPAGELSPDAATTFVILGIVALALAINSRRATQRVVLMIAAAPLLASTVGPAQRAAFLGLAISVGVLIILVAFSNRRLQSRPAEWALAGLAITAFILGPTVIASVHGETAAELPFQSQLVTGLIGSEERLTTRDRVNQFDEAMVLIEQRPIYGWGLGKTYSYFEPGTTEFIQTDVTHNVFTDLLLRSGVVGLLLFVVAILVTLAKGVGAWYRATDPRVAALALGLVAGVSGLLAKGVAESVFEKYRLALVLALMVGMLLSAASAPGDTEPRSA